MASGAPGSQEGTEMWCEVAPAQLCARSSLCQTNSAADPAPPSSAAGRTCHGQRGELNPRTSLQRGCATGVMVLLLEHLEFTPGILIFPIKSFGSLTFMQLSPSITSQALRPGAIFCSYLPELHDESISAVQHKLLLRCQNSKADEVAIIKVFMSD